ncbi:MAG: cation diffusion facilitator family transporter [Verrucomicrobiales bacterium]
MKSATANPSLVRFAWLSVGAALLTFFLKLLAWQVTGSVSLLSDALESLANLAAALIAMASLTVAARPADDDHAYGHTKAEYFASGIEGGLIMIAAAGIGWSAVDRLWSPRLLEQPLLGVALSSIASVVNLAVARVLQVVGRRHHSVALEADAKHLMTDVWTSAVVIVAVGLVTLTGWAWLDPVLGLLLACHIVVTGIKLVHHSMLGLMDTGLPAEELEKIRTVLDGFAADGVQHHALRTRVAGARRFMSVHLLFPGAWSVARAHALSEKIEAALRAEVPRLTILTHLEPIEDPASWSDVGLDRPSSGSTET